MKIRKVGGYVNYDKSEFAPSTELFEGDDSALERVWNQQHKLGEFVNPETFKSYDELKEKLDAVVGTDIRASAPVKEKTIEDVQPTPSESVSDSTESGSSDKQSTMDYFEDLMNENS